ncbi:hypothetical protein KPH14_012570 [Odynerus spinipes]|uniref:C2H2-type domain-containing protein n=1 Tax=Odynerus spinipes TaxID=1348599 RepID=A0AAD9R9L1_9HYME|nr:hypothetical protein KPH14_012570 [Odynerus spinipes]
MRMLQRGRRKEVRTPTRAKREETTFVKLVPVTDDKGTQTDETVVAEWGEHLVKMFGEGAMWDDYGNNNEDKSKEEMPETLVVDVDIPLVKSEPMSPTRSNSYESLQDEIMASHLPIVTPCKLKEPIILLERCDKIWETLKLIKDVQGKDLEDTVNDSAEKMDTMNSTVFSSEKDQKASYIRYQPVLGNNNSALPNFQLSVKSTKKLFHCNVCGKEYSENRSLRAHSQKIHGIFIPPKRRPKLVSNTNNKIDTTKSESKDGKSLVNNTINHMEKNAFNKEGANSQVEKKNNTLVKNAIHSKGATRAKCPLCKRIVSNLHKHLTEYHKINCPNLIIKELESVQSHTEITLKDFTKAIVNTTPPPEIFQNGNIKASKQAENDVQNFKNNSKQKHDETYSMPQKKFKLDKDKTLNVTNASENLLTQKSPKANRHKCEICLGTYASYSSFYKHRRIHRKRGETKNNFNALKCRYINSPLNNKRNELINLKATDNASTITPNAKNKEKVKRISLDSMENASSHDSESGIYDHNEINKVTTENKTYSDNLDRSCICGRSFRDYHTLVLHKRGCKFRDTDETESFMEDNPDRDSGNGINIKIKKKNDSYEIVSRDSGDENKSKDSGHPNDCDTPSNISDFIAEDYNETLDENQSVNIFESSKYSKSHSILKIQTIDDESIDIDIEEDSQNSSWNENEEKNQINKRIKSENIHEKNENNNITGIPTLAHLCETIFTDQLKTEDTSAVLKTKQKRSSNVRNTTDTVKLEKEQSIEAVDTSDYLKTKNKHSTKLTNQNSLSNTSMYMNTTCPCGESFKTLKSCNSHIAKYHPLFLRCGYCTERFNSIAEYNNHRCSIEKGKMFNKLQTDISCPFCKIILKSRSEFDRHIHFQHFDSELPYQCYECTCKFASNKGRHSHFKSTHNRCECNVCGTKLTAATKLRHEGYHYGLGYPCHICKRTHAHQQNLSSHYKLVHEEENKKLVTCNICLKTMKSTSLSWHVYSHKTLTTCELCKKILCDGRNLEHHIITRHQEVKDLKIIVIYQNMDNKENDKPCIMAENSAINTENMEIESCIEKGSECEVMEVESKKTSDTAEEQDTSNFEENNKILEEIKSLKEDINNDEAVAEMSLTTANSIESCDATTSQESSPTSSNIGCTNGDSGISVEKSENSSEEDLNKLHVNEKLVAKENVKSEDAEANTECENVSTTNNPKFHKLKSKVKKRNYRNKKNVTNDTGDNSSDMVVDDSSSNLQEPNNSASSRGVDQNHEGRVETNSNASDQEEEAADDANEWTTASEDESEEETVPACLKKEQPKPNFFIVPDLIKRDMGLNPLLHRRYYGSLHVVQRLELMYKLNEHQGCVNTLHFNQKGNLLASGSDDLTIVIWDWAVGKKHLHFDSGHKSNLFQAKWLPFDVEYLMVTCARDGQVRLLDLRHSSSRKLASHYGPSHKLAIHPDTPHVIISVGEDAKVFSIDIRESKPSKLLVVKDGSSDIPLYSVHSNPLNSNEFCVGGSSHLVKVYDRRKVSAPLYDLCPDHLATKRVHVTCVVYNYNGTEILASYNDEDIYLFDTIAPKRGDFAHRYQGHRNNATVKGVNFFGPKSEFILSGSDCGNIFIWDKNTEAIVQWMPGDEQGVVNHLEPHPHIPILATSGLDYDVKIWIPSSENPPTMTNLDKCVKYNLRCREMDNVNEPSTCGVRYIERLMQFIAGTNSRRRNADDDGNGDASSDDNTSSVDSDSESEGNEAGRLACRPS